MSTLAHFSSIATTHGANSPSVSLNAFRIDATVSPHPSSATAKINASVADAAHRDLTPDAQELAQEINRYKFRHRRRFINYEEILSVVKTLGYRKDFA